MCALSFFLESKIHKMFDIALYVNKVGTNGWTPRDTFFGGTEEYVVETAAILARYDYRVAVYHNGPTHGPFGKVHYLPREHYMPPRLALIAIKDVPTTLCAKRNIYFTNNIHDKAINFPQFDAVIGISNFHADAFLGRAANVRIIGHACWTDALRPEKKVPWSFLYSSSPDRGLERVLQLWPKIKAHHPQATLHVTYGGTAARNMDGVVYHGALSQKDMNELYKTCQFWLHPCDGIELFCISGYKATVAECIPIFASKMALPETVNGGFSANTFEEAVDSFLNCKELPKPSANHKDWLDVTFELMSLIDEAIL
jgi:hypothetical protein